MKTAILALVLCIGPVSAQDVSIRLEGSVFKVVNVPSSIDRSRLADFFSVYVDSRLSVPPISGTYRIEGRELIFQPRFPVEPGLRYRAQFKPDGAGAPITATFDIPKADRSSSTVVTAVYPSADDLPDNQLKFYIHFSAPMGRGEAYMRVHLLDESGREVAFPFLELGEELWDQEARRFTLLFDPGRVKRGLVPYNEVGPPLKQGMSYTLEIDRDWTDADGLSLKEGFRKKFRVGPADRKPVDLRSWRVKAPRAASLEPLVVEFPEPLDRALLERSIEVRDGQGRALGGTVRIDHAEMRWNFYPKARWAAGDYELAVDVLLTDLAGNRVDRLFDVDVFERVDEKLSSEIKTLRFTISPRKQ